MESVIIFIYSYRDELKSVTLGAGSSSTLSMSVSERGVPLIVALRA